eukprot:SAG31_NODE_5332_length_2603_cov_2.775958_2_plen_175_part_00
MLALSLITRQELDVEGVTTKKRQLAEYQAQQQIIRAGVENLRDGLDRAKFDVDRANKKAFAKISANFSELFTMLVPSKHGRLQAMRDQDKSAKVTTRAVESGNEREDSDDFKNASLDSIDFVVHPKATVHSEILTGGVTQLSGGQKTLLGIAVICTQNWVSTVCISWSNAGVFL